MVDKEKIIVDSAVLQDGKKKLSCPQAFKISKEHGISLKEIGDICNKNNIKIHSCQLGCFE
jgi:hypothetical protein